MHDLLSSDDTSDGVSVKEEVVEVGAPATAPQAPRLSKAVLQKQKEVAERAKTKA